MSTLLVELYIAAERGQELRDAFSRFRPVISSQPGFQSVTLLRPQDRQGHQKDDAASLWVLVICFAAESDRLRWVATHLHGEVWPEIAGCCDGVEATVFEAVP